MTAMAFAVATFGIALGWLNDDGPLLILGFFAALLGVALLANLDGIPERDEDAELGDRYPIHRRLQ